jgi:hypothetical protein
MPSLARFAPGLAVVIDLLPVASVDATGLLTVTELVPVLAAAV